MASARLVWSSEITCPTPVRPRAPRVEEIGDLAGPVFGCGQVDAKDLGWAAALIATVSRQAMVTIRPPSRTFTNRRASSGLRPQEPSPG